MPDNFEKHERGTHPSGLLPHVLSCLAFDSITLISGNFISNLVGGLAGEYQKFISAIFNGIFYGTILWLVFVAVSRRYEKEK